MGINQAFSSWLRGAQSFATTTLRAAQGYGAALQQQTMTAVSAAQRAAVQPFKQAIQPRPPTRPTSSSPHTARTLTPVDAVTRAVSGGVQGVQEAARQIVRAHAPIVQGVQRDVGRVIQGVPAAARSAPAAVSSGVQQIARAHSPIMQGIQRDAGRAAQAIPAPVRSAVSQIARAHAPIAQGLQRDAARVVSGGLGAATSAMIFANQRKAAAQAELTRTAGPAAPFEKGCTHPVYKWGREANKAYQGFVDQVYPLWSRTQPLHAISEIRQFQRGIARAPGSLLEGLSFIPPAAERGGQLLWKEPHKLPETAAKFAGQQIEGLGAAYERDPYDFAGEMIGTAALSYGIGAAARPGAVARGSGTPKPRAAAGGTGSPGGAGGRFRALEFGFQTKLVRKPPTSQKPFSLAEWQKERQRYAPARAAIQVKETPMRTQAQTQPRADPGKGGASRQTSPPPESSRSRAVYGSPSLLTGHMPAPVAPADPVVLPTTMPPGAPQRGGRGPQTDQVVRGARISSTSMTQDLASIEADVMTMITPPPSILAQPMATSMIIRPGAETKAQTSPPRPRQAPGGPPFTVQPPKTTARGKDKKKKGEEERRRRKKKGEADHWEYGPAPGINEMGMLIFGSPRRSVLNLGGSPLSFGFAARAPARPPVIPSFGPPSAGAPGKKPAHAGKSPVKKNGAKKKK